jgi:LacI family transcriptional regulator
LTGWEAEGIIGCVNGYVTGVAVGKPTIRDVASLADVSVATVSRILNGQSGYGEETKARVVEAIERLGYTPNAFARGLQSSSLKTIGVLMPVVTDAFASLLLEGVEAEAQSRGFSVIVCNTEGNGRRTLEYLRVLSEKRVDGVIFVSEEITDEYGTALESLGVPVVLASTRSTRFPFPSVKVDDKLAAYHAVKYLIDRGHREIGLIAGTVSDPIAGTPRIEGWREALRDHGLPCGDELIAHGDFHFKSGIAAAARLVPARPSMTAIFAASDEMALGVLSFAYSSGIEVPGRLSVIGYDDTLAAEMSIPPLTTVHQPIREIGRQAASLLFEKAPKATSRIMPFTITERASVRDLNV